MKIEVGGQIQGISLSSFLQIVQMDKTSCTLKIYSTDEVGFLWIHEGNLVAAETDHTNGLDAVYDIICWNDTVIVIDNTPAPDHNITTPLMTILMEGLRLRDEKAAQQADAIGMEITPELPDAQGTSVDDEIAMNFVVDAPTKKSAFPEDEPPAMPSMASDDHLEMELSHNETPPSEEASASEEADTEQDADASQEAWDFIYEDIDEEPEPRNFIKTILVGFLVILILGGGAFAGFIWYQSKNLKEEYASLEAELGRLRNFKQQKMLLETYLDSHVANQYTAQVTEYLNESTRLIEINRRIAGMERDRKFIKEALGLFKKHLRENRGTPFMGAIRKRMKALPTELDDLDFRRVLDATEEEPEARLGLYRAYLEDHPDGKHRREVENLVAAIGDEFYFAIQQSLSSCYKTLDWAPCIAIADTFLAEFPNERRYNDVWIQREDMIDHTDFEALKVKAEALSPREARKLYTTYLKKKPATTMAPEVQKELLLIAQKIEQLGIWEELQASANNTSTAYKVRVRELNDFIREYPDGPYTKEAKALREKIQKVGSKTKSKNTISKEQLAAKQAKRRQQIERQKAIAARKEAEATAREKAQQKALLRSRQVAMRAKLYGKESRFTDNRNGTVTDKHSGLIWALLDSKGMLSPCMDFNSAKAWVNKLTLGGKSDWRLPSPNELALLYNGKPWYPSSGVPWYWTSKVNTGAWGDPLDVVIFNPNEKTSFTRDTLSLDQCGYVHAVRTP